MMGSVRRKRLGRATVAAFLLLAIAAGAWFVWSTFAAERREAAFRAKGYPTTPAELNLWYAQPPSGENAASYYLKAGKEIAASDFPELDQIAFLGSDSENAKLGMLGEEIPEEELQRTAAFLLYHDEAFDLLAQAAQLEGSRYPVDFTAGVSVSFAHYGVIREVWRASMLKTYFSAASGNPADAVSTFNQLTAVVNSLDEEPWIIAALTRIALMYGAVEVSEYMLNDLQFDSGQLDDIDRALLSLTDNQHTLRAAVGERCYNAGLLANATGVSAILAAIMKKDNLKAYDDMIELLEKPLHEIVHELKRRETVSEPYFDLHDIAWLDRWTNALPMRDEGMLVRVALFYGDRNAQAAAARGAVQIEKARAAGLPLPERLEDLPPGYHQEWPTDPYTNKPIHYRKLASGYITYSVGQDLIDDEGGIDDASPPDAHHESDNPDIVFRVYQ